MTALRLVSDEVDPQIVGLLEHVSLFEAIKKDAQAIATFAHFTSLASFKNGETIIKEGEQGDRMFIMMTGTAVVCKNTSDGENFRVAILSSEDRPFFGEGGLLDEDARSATIKAESDCTCVVLTRESFDEFGRQYPNWALPIMKKVSQTVMRRLTRQGNDIVLLYNALVNQIRGA